tara:strand:+ start:36185 stop:36688 length:504 start_codon:yes stop_codon:yes gene_type:complete
MSLKSKNPKSTSLKQPLRPVEMSELVLDSTIPYQINRLAHQMNQMLEQELKSHSLSMANWRVMAVLNFNSSATVNQLSDYAMIEQSTVSRLLQRMVKEGYLENNRSSTDGRQRSIVLTKKGTQKYNVVRDVTMKHVARILHGFSHDEQFQLLQIVGRMQENIDSSTP